MIATVSHNFQFVNTYIVWSNHYTSFLFILSINLQNITIFYEENYWNNFSYTYGGGFEWCLRWKCANQLSYKILSKDYWNIGEN